MKWEHYLEYGSDGEVDTDVKGRSENLNSQLHTVKLVNDSLERWRGSTVGQNNFYRLILLD